MRYYEPKRDRVLSLLLLSGPLVLGLVGWQLWAEGRLLTTMDGWVFLTVALSTLALISWIWFGTGYGLDDKQLRVRSGPLRKTIALDRIRYVRAGRSWHSAPALSAQRLHVGVQNGRLVDEVAIAPADQKRFLADLQQRNPTVVVHGSPV